MAFPSSGLRFRLMLLVILAMLPMFGLLLYQASTERARKLHEVQEDATRIAEITAGSVSQVVEGVRQMLRSIAFSEQVRAMDGPACSALFAHLLEQSANVHNIGLAQPDGLIIASAVPMNGVAYSGEPAWFTRVQQRRAFAVGDFQQGKIIRKPTLVLSSPIPGQPENQPLAALYASLNLELLQSCISRHRIIPQSVIAVVERNGIELARNPDAAKWVGHKVESWPTLSANTGLPTRFVETAGVDGVNRMYYTVGVPGSDNGLFIVVGVAKEALLAKIQDEFFRNLIWLAIFTLLALLFAWFVADLSVIRHVKRLTEASRRLAEGNWDTQAKLAGGARELQQLGHAFDDMAGVLRQHRDQLEELVEQRTFELSRTNAFLTEEINERKQAEALSKKALTNLERSNKELEQFAYVASHDLQEPLRLVSAYTQLLMQRYGDKLDAEADPIVKFITEGVTRMQRLIQDLLAYSRVSSQGRTLSFADAQTALEAAERNLAMAISEHNAVITHDPLPALLCDLTKLGQLFQNLISNAIKFHGKAPPCIHVGVRKTDDDKAWLFSVSDNGIGIERDYFERIFVIFQRLHTRAKYPGTGIGLAICKRIVEHHGGEIWVESAPGKGCIFFFTIPINPDTL